MSSRGSDGGSPHSIEAEQSVLGALLRSNDAFDRVGDIVMLVHRPEMYEPENMDLRGYAEVLLRKQRGGPLGDIALMFDGPTCSFSDWSGPAPGPGTAKGRGPARFTG